MVLGITGGPGTGKSTVTRMFRRLGARVLDADAIAHAAVLPGRPGWRRVRRAFGTGVCRADGAVDRRRLAAVVFRSPVPRRRLERIVHPFVLREIRRRLRLWRRSGGVVALELPLLFEAGARRLVDRVIVITAPRDVQQRRLVQAYGWSKEDIAQRIRAQWDLAAKAALADHVIDNGRSLAATRTQVTAVWTQLRRARQAKTRSSTSRR